MFVTTLPVSRNQKLAYGESFHIQFPTHVKLNIEVLDANSNRMEWPWGRRAAVPLADAFPSIVDSNCVELLLKGHSMLFQETSYHRSLLQPRTHFGQCHSRRQQILDLFWALPLNSVSLVEPEFPHGRHILFICRIVLCTSSLVFIMALLVLIAAATG